MKLILFGNKFYFLFFLFSINLSSQTYFEDVSNIAFGFYQNVMSPVKDDVSKCQFYPSCSQFGKESISQFGFLKGSLLTSDRFMRCSGGHLPHHSYPRVGKLFFDPPNKNFLFGDGHLWNIGLVGTLESKKSNEKDSNIFSFAKYLFLNEDYEASNLELKRILFNQNNLSDIKNKTELLLSINYLRQQNTDLARKHIELISVKENNLDFNSNIVKFLVNDFDNVNLYNQTFLNNLIISNSDSILLYKKLLTYTNYKIEYNINKNNDLKKVLKDLEESNFDNIENLNLFINNSIDMKSKSPTIAGILSAVLPGTGYIYTGKTKEGLSAMLINGLLGAGIYSLFKNENYSAGILTSLVATPFYLGNIVGSVNSAHLYNNKIKQMYLLQLRSELGIDYYFSINFLEYCW